jgi:hypothetical protein
LGGGVGRLLVILLAVGNDPSSKSKRLNYLPSGLVGTMIGSSRTQPEHASSTLRNSRPFIWDLAVSLVGLH